MSFRYGDKVLRRGVHGHTTIDMIPDSARQRGKSPPLRIHHLLLWMTVPAALISFCL